MTPTVEMLSGIYVLLSILATIQIVRKRRSAFVIGLISQLFMIALIIIDPKLYWFAIQTLIYGVVNIVGLRSISWKNDPWW
jgi:nicotinamide riboside transporter PnuC